MNHTDNTARQVHFQRHGKPAEEILSKQDEMASNQEAKFASLAKVQVSLADLSRAATS